MAGASAVGGDDSADGDDAAVGEASGVGDGSADEEASGVASGVGDGLADGDGPPGVSKASRVGDTSAAAAGVAPSAVAAGSERPAKLSAMTTASSRRFIESPQTAGRRHRGRGPTAL